MLHYIQYLAPLWYASVHSSPVRFLICEASTTHADMPALIWIERRLVKLCGLQQSEDWAGDSLIQINSSATLYQSV
jgi:hypothetical protein